jgi:hypothetical protein
MRRKGGKSAITVRPVWHRMVGKQINGGQIRGSGFDGIVFSDNVMVAFSDNLAKGQGVGCKKQAFAGSAKSAECFSFLPGVYPENIGMSSVISVAAFTD